jgi:hypothetical protein
MMLLLWRREVPAELGGSKKKTRRRPLLQHWMKAYMGAFEG